MVQQFFLVSGLYKQVLKTQETVSSAIFNLRTSFDGVVVLTNNQAKITNLFDRKAYLRVLKGGFGTLYCCATKAYIADDIYFSMFQMVWVLSLMLEEASTYMSDFILNRISKLPTVNNTYLNE